ncbi:MAG: photosystem II S4 domain protein [Cyanobacteriota bacterium]|nr:photosystem II S4 domain protein [Cyanobacteriota bacterium]
MLPRRELLARSTHPTTLALLMEAADTALRTWQPVWSGFVGAAQREEAMALLGGLAELNLHDEGGRPGAERRRLLLQRAEAALDPALVPSALAGLEISGNFLFDPADATAMNQALRASGASPHQLGDLWLRGDRGAQVIVTEELARQLDGANGQVGSVPVQFTWRPLVDLQPPQPRLPKPLSTVEASLRLDAVASAGFGLSRARMADLIRAGAVRLNWQPVTSPSRELSCGDRVRLDDRGELEVLTIERTKRDRFRLELMRR